MISTGMSMMAIRTEWIDFMKGFMLLVSIFLAMYMNMNKKYSPFNIFKKRSAHQ
jgi:ABC-type xylose transport system permease subunit